MTNRARERKRALGFSEALVVLYAGHFDEIDDVSFFCRAAGPAAIRHGATIALVGDGPELDRPGNFFRRVRACRFGIWDGFLM